MDLTANVAPADRQMANAERYWKSALWLLGIRGNGVTRLLRLVSFVLVIWSLLAWGAALALVTRVEMANADVIVVLSNPSAYVERTRHAAQLWKTGRAPRVLLTNENLRSSWSEAEQRNPLFSERATQELKRAGVSPDKIEVLPATVRNTFDEAVLLRQYAAENKLQSILIVTSAYHSRRALWTFRNVFRDSDIAIGLDPVAPGLQTPTPASWWLKPAAWKIVALEYPKLVYYWVRYQALPGGTNVGEAIPQPRPQVDAKTTVGASLSGITLSITVPTSAFVDEVVLIDARKSVGLSNRPQSDSTPSLEINFGDGFKCNLLACGHAYRSPGNYTITVSGKNRSGLAAPSVSVSISVTSIPAASNLNINNGPGQNVIDMTVSRGNGAYYIPPAAYRNAAANAVKLQNAIKRAAANNVSGEQEIILPAGAVFAGPISMIAPRGNKYITIKSGSLASLPQGERVSPVNAAMMPTITAPSSTNATLAAMWTPTPAELVPSHHYRLQGIHFAKNSEAHYSAMLLSLGDFNSVQDTLAETPYNFIVDRCWLDGGAIEGSVTNSGIRIAADYVTVVDSHSGEFRLIGVGVDTTAITIGKGRGPYSIVNNTLIAGSENFFVGGGAAELNTGKISSPSTTSCTLSSVVNLELDQNIALPLGGVYSAANSTIVRSINGNNITFDPIRTPPDTGGTAQWAATPSYIEFRRNYLYKPLKWRAGHPSYVGFDIQIKNLWETKNSRYVVVDANVMENTWVKDQSYAIAITPRKTNGGETVAAVTRELQFSNNIIRSAGNGVIIAAADGQNPYNAVQLTTDITFRNNLFWNVGINWDSTGASHMMLNLNGGPDGSGGSVQSKRIFIIHNTHDNGVPDNTYGQIIDFGDPSWGGGALESMWFNNVHQHGGYGFRSNLSVVDSAANIARFLPPGNTTVWNRNLIVNKGDANYPASGIYVSGSWPKLFVDYANGNFALASGMRGKGAATDGTDVGVDMGALIEATAGVQTGSSGSIQSTRPRRVSD